MLTGNLHASLEHAEIVLNGALADSELLGAGVALVQALALLAIRVRGRRTRASALDGRDMLVPATHPQ